jgi:hypothetical protein
MWMGVDYLWKPVNIEKCGLNRCFRLETGLAGSTAYCESLFVNADL